MTHSLNFELALLLEDAKITKEIVALLRQKNITPHYYNTLEEYWNAVIGNPPTLSIIDVKLMSDGNMILKNHPYVLDNVLNVAFTYSSVTAPLIFSTFDIFHLGLINTDYNLVGQINNLLSRIEEREKIVSEREEAKVSISVLERMSAGLTAGLEEQKLKTFSSDFSRRFFKLLPSLSQVFKGSFDFMQVLKDSISRMNEIEAFSFMELSKVRDAFESPIIAEAKYVRLLGFPLLDADAKASFQTALELACEKISPMVVGLKVGKGADFKMIFIKLFNEKMASLVDWNFFESYLEGLYSLSLSEKVERVEPLDKKILNSWEFYSLLSSGQGYAIVDLNFSKLLSFLSSSTDPFLSESFAFETFFKDFSEKLDLASSISFKVHIQGLKHMTLIVNELGLDTFWNDVLKFTKNFPYWQYFDHPEGLLSVSDFVSIKMLPLSILAYNSHTGQDFLDSKSFESKKTKQVAAESVQ